VRSRPDRLVCGAVLFAVCAFAISTAVRAGEQSSSHDTSERFTPVEIARAVARVKADPNLAAERTIRTLRWKTADQKPTPPPGWMRWIAGFFRWLGESARLLIWVAAVVLAAMLVAFVIRLLRERTAAKVSERFVAPTHVRDLDIRPETLPDDIGAAARELWDRGDHRAALALLYRGLLSRLAHVHQVPIRHSSTEGDCLALAEARLASGRWDYAARLVGVWQRAVYGREAITAAAVYGLCDGFAAALDPETRLDPARREGTA
jgi:hypothetical protein